MKLLADQDVYAITITFLSGLGHDVLSAAQLGLSQAEDSELLRVAHEHNRIFVTRDRDFGAWSFFTTADRESSICAFCLRLRMPCTLNSNES
jgi:predicted nuclease of predicted toxin-antitoxin system